MKSRLNTFTRFRTQATPATAARDLFSDASPVTVNRVLEVSFAVMLSEFPIKGALFSGNLAKRSSDVQDCNMWLPRSRSELNTTINALPS